ncbi:hypothetical protein NLU13_8916 [Sarocladium strictum]|uniref:Uncharacterized protein n=1 Tax=Sarocladium strictum TaxID=5046 RepID=A0AA39L3V6_SARSR|nr:hypothetical protein NLU13_8916 [Sarocladium strictum]
MGVEPIQGPEEALLPTGLYSGLSRCSWNGRCLRSDSATAPDRLPGHPQTRLTRHEIRTFLQQDLCTRELDRFSPCLWLVATQDSSHISSLTHQIVRGREITITENPELHLVWHRMRVFVKPIPAFLLSDVFWDVCINSTSGADSAVLEAALGFMRSYVYLIRHPSDFALAVEKGLIPVDCNGQDGRQPAGKETVDRIDYTTFIMWMEKFSQIEDQSVSLRYHYGDLRLSRLNFWAKFALRRTYFSKAHGNYQAYFSRFYGPLLFVFAVLSLAMTAIQLGWSCQEALQSVDDWRPLYMIGRYMSVTILGIVGSLSVFLVVMFLALVARETLFALRGRA